MPREHIMALAGGSWVVAAAADGFGRAADRLRAVRRAVNATDLLHCQGSGWGRLFSTLTWRQPCRASV